MPELVSAVGGGDFRTSIDIRLLANGPVFSQASYEPEVVSFITLRVEDDSPAVMVYQSGKYNIAGADSIPKLKETASQVSSILSTEFEYSITDPSFEVRYLTFKGTYGTELQLSAISDALGAEADYDPSSNPAVIYRPIPDLSTVFSIYRTGSIILTGVESEEKAEQLFNDLFYQIDQLIV